MRYKAPSIKSVGGLKVYLDTKYADYGGYDEFIRRYSLHEPKTVIARAFGLKTGLSIGYWIKIHLEEVKTKNQNA